MKKAMKLYKMMLMTCLIMLALFQPLISNQELTIIKSTPNEIVIEYTPIAHTLKPIIGEDGTTFFEVNTNYTSKMYNTPGAPNITALSSLISLASKNSFLKLDVKSDFEIIDGLLVPIKTPIYDSPFDPERIVKNDSLYSNSIQDFASFEYKGVLRNRYAGELKVFPYIQQKNGIAKLKKALITITLDGTIGNTPTSEDNFLSNMFLNSGTSNDFVVRSATLTSTKQSHKLLSSDNRQWLLVEVPQDAIYRITLKDITSAGKSLSNSDIKSIKLFGTSGDVLSESVSEYAKTTMNEQPLIVNQNSDGSLDEIIFFGSGTKGFKKFYENTTKDTIISHFTNYYAKTNYYLLSWGEGEGLRAKEKKSPLTPVSVNPSTYYHRVFFEEDSYNPEDVGAGRVWVGKPINKSSYITQLYNFVRTGNIRYTFGIANKSNYNAYLDIFDNGYQITKDKYLSSRSTYTSATFYHDDYSLSTEKIASDSRSKLEFNYKPSNGDYSATAYLDYFEISYPRSLIALDNEIDFFLNQNIADYNKTVEFSFSGFENTIYGFDISNRNKPILLKNISNIGSIFTFQDSISVKNKIKHYYISGKTKTPKLSSVNYNGLSEFNNGADIIVVYHPEFEKAAQKYKAFRDAQGKYSTYLASLKDIYLEYSSNKPDPTAIRNYAAWAFNNWQIKPKFMLLLGDGHYDLRNISVKKTNHIPAFQNADHTRANSVSESSDYGTDDFYAAIDGNDSYPDIAIGRLPAETKEEANLLVEKIINYENNSYNGNWQTISTFLADDSNAEERDDDDAYVSSTETMIETFFPSFLVSKKYYSAAFPTEFISGRERRKPDVTKAMLNQINNEGTLILNYVGHSNPRVWSHEEFLDRDKTIPMMINNNKLFFALSASCTFNRYDDPSTRSGAEAMILHPLGGAIAVYAASRIVYQSSNMNHSQNFYKALFSFNENNGQYSTIGEAQLLSKLTDNTENTRKYVLLGDPALHLKIPVNNVLIDSIDNVALVSEADSIIQLKGLQKVKVTGKIIDNQGNFISTYNGRGVLTLYDGDENMMVTDDDNKTYKFLAYGGLLNKSTFTVKNGRFETEFIMPKDITYSEHKGRMFVFTYEDETNITAKGFFDKLKIFGLDDREIDDFDGPKIDIYMDSRESFTSGAIVSQNPYVIVDLFDISGINATGLGIGHKIEAWIDDNPQSINLTPKYTISFDDSKRGTASDQISGLESGLHKITVRAWDVYNNYSIDSTFFRIKDKNEGIDIYQAINFPNPFNSSTVISFSHNAEPPVDAEFQLFDEGGKMIANKEFSIVSLSKFEFTFDGTDNSGNKLAQGPYYYSIIVKDKNKTSVCHGTMIFLK